MKVRIRGTSPSAALRTVVQSRMASLPGLSALRVAALDVLREPFGRALAAELRGCQCHDRHPSIGRGLPGFLRPRLTDGLPNARVLEVVLFLLPGAAPDRPIRKLVRLGEVPHRLDRLRLRAARITVAFVDEQVAVERQLLSR